MTEINTAYRMTYDKLAATVNQGRTVDLPVENEVYGSNLRSVSFGITSAIYSYETKQVFQVMVHTNELGNLYWVDREYEVAVRDTNVIDGKSQCYSIDSLLTIASAATNKEDWDSDLLNDIELNMPQDEFDALQYAADLRGVSIEVLVNEAVAELVEQYRDSTVSDL
jgi:hypothetical protein